MIVLTIVMLILVLHFVRRSYTKRPQETTVPNIVVTEPTKEFRDKQNNRISALEPEEHWMSTLKEQSHHDVFVDTVDETGAEKDISTSLNNLKVKETNNLETTPTGSETELMAPGTYELKNY
jgi:hypothetical protein